MKYGKYVQLSAVLALAVLIFASFLTACHDDNNSSNVQNEVLSEQNFVDDANLRANPEEGLVALFLEPPDAAEVDNLTGDLGFDVIPYKYNRTLNHTFCFLNPEDTEHTVRLQRSNGEEILTALPNGQCVTALVEPGDHQVVLTHGQHVSTIEPVFLITLPDTQEFSMNNSNSTFAKLLESVSNIVTRPALAQTTDDNVTTLISTNSCVNCDLSGVDLTGNDLTFVTLSGADLSNANLSGVSLFEGLMVGTNFSGADLSSTDLIGSDMSGADLTNADLTNATLTNAELTMADFTGATITDAEFDFADLVSATWIDGSTCDITSVGFCNPSSGGTTNPCDSVSLVITHDFNVAYKCLLPEVPTEICMDGTDIVSGAPVTVCEPNDDEEPITSVDLVDIFDQVSSTFNLSLDNDTPFAVLAWGGSGGKGSNGLFTSGASGGDGGFASTVSTLSDFLDVFNQTEIYYYIGEGGTLSNVDGDGGSSTMVMVVESNPSSLDDIVVLGGGGAGGSSGGTFTDGAKGGMGGIAASSQIGQGFIGVGQGINSGADGGSTDGTSLGGNGTNDGRDGIGGQGGQGFLGANSEWINGDPDVGSDGRGGNVDDGFSSDGGGGGGGGLGGGGAGDGEPGAGGGSYSVVPTITCNSAPNNDVYPSSPGSSRDSLGSKNGGVEVWIFANGCN